MEEGQREDEAAEEHDAGTLVVPQQQEEAVEIREPGLTPPTSAGTRDGAVSRTDEDGGILGHGLPISLSCPTHPPCVNFSPRSAKLLSYK